MKKNYFKIVLIILIALATFGAGLIYSEYIKVPESLKESRNIDAQVERFREDDARIAIFYPEIENDVFNERINEIKEEIKGQLVWHPEEEIKVDYSMKTINSSVISILFDVTSNQSTDVLYKSILLDNATYQEIGIDSLFDETLLRKLSAQLRTKLKKMDTMQDVAYTLDFINKTSSDSSNFNTFLLSEERIDFVFSSNQLGNHPNLIFSFELNKIANYINLELPVTQAEDSLLTINERYVDPNRPMVAITYDDGPVKKYTPQLIDLYEHYGQAATFYVLGSRIPGNEHLVRELISNGNEAASHSYSHPKLNQLSGSKLDFELNETARLINQLSDGIYEMKTFRPPYGSSNDKVKKASNYPFILWNIDTLDWSTRNTQSTIDNIMNNVQDGDIILMHELYEESVQATKEVIPMLIEKGFQLVTVTELMECKGIDLKAGVAYRSAN